MTDLPHHFRAAGSALWPPYAPLTTTEAPVVVATRDCHLQLADGRELIDGVASWWTACHGYNAPAIAEAVRAQLDAMPHVMMGGLAHPQALRLAERLRALLGGEFARAFFCESGSVSVEVALKMAVQYWLNQGERGRTRFLAFRDGYHGDTFGTMGLCDPDAGMHRRWQGILPQALVAELPRDEASAQALDTLLAERGTEIAAIVVEPLVQGAGGMRFHSPQTLQRLRALADRHGLLLVFDEIFTGFGRTGEMFAFQHAGVAPDIITLSKALTGGTLPLAATVANRKVEAAFLDDDPARALMHGPTFMGNALACAAANASLDLFEQAPRLAQARRLQTRMEAGLAACRDLPWVADVRCLGAIGVVELTEVRDLKALRARFIERGVWLRPFGRVVYLTPALVMDDASLARLMETVREVLGSGAP
ncbi:Adenosylmethionine-8-amino-7-oxononanoate aminotransferase [plant metagenome]|uniref:Adenosylmethionine-8-amino-7-oxononanoate aminotransferase n=1 Tax=plant metagenome TaxID=1297885 RepID=A0A484V5J1_9ZZZZ